MAENAEQVNKGPDREITRADVLDEMRTREDTHEPWTTTELVEVTGYSRSTIYNRLRELVSLDEVRTKKLGGNTRVWWIPADTGE